MAKRQGLFDDVMSLGLKLPWKVAMGWRDLERLVGEMFRKRGFKVTGFGGRGPDGGVDLGLSRGGERFLVQCKHWKKQSAWIHSPLL